MRADESGVRVDWISPQGSADGKLQVGDTLLGIDGKPIANDGTITAGDLRLPFGMLVDRHQIGENLALRVLRKSERMDVTVALLGNLRSVYWSNSWDHRPRYYVYAGLVFVPLDREMLKTFGDKWMTEANAELLYEFLIRPQGEPEILKKERVVLLRRLDDPVNANIAFYKNIIVERVNGKAIASLQDLIQAIATNHDPCHTLDFGYFGHTAVIDREAADKANPDILRRYGITEDRRL
jgi:hypothetical protein